VAVRIIDLVQQPDVSLTELADVISKDAALASKILRTANSSHYARTRAVSKLSDALIVLGLRRVKTLSLGFSLIDDLRGRGAGGFDHESFWERTLLSATAARSVAGASGKVDREEAFLGGLTHCLGVLALNQALGGPYEAMVAECAGDFWQLLEIESRELGFNHAEVGGALAEKWNLPAQLAAGLRYFPAPEWAPEKHRDFVRCVTAGAWAAETFMSGKPAAAGRAFHEQCERWLGVSTDATNAVLASLDGEAAPMRELLNLPAPLQNVGAILAQANEALELITFEAENENVRLEEERTRLAAAASVDGLTGIPNRAQFDAFLEAAVRQARHDNTPLSLVMIDLDHFKRVNDTHGHPAGDAVLRAVAAALAGGIRGSDMVARYGGEEFAVVAPETGAAGAFVLAQRLREKVESLDTQLPDGVAFKATASFGVATFDPHHQGGAAKLVEQADRALYAAKDAGRNTVKLAQTPNEKAA
jgi:diguanylate cyclase (GGDEF)-like protein